MKIKQLYIILFAEKNDDSANFITQISQDGDHLFWGACRDFASEILLIDKNWKWLGYRFDDFALEIQKNMQKKLQVWLFKAQLNSNKMKIDTIENTIYWLLDRYVAEAKNLFDKRAKNHIDIAEIDYLIKLSYIQRGKIC